MLPCLSFGPNAFWDIWLHRVHTSHHSYMLNKMGGERTYPGNLTWCIFWIRTVLVLRHVSQTKSMRIQAHSCTHIENWPWIHGHHQMLCFFLFNTLPGLYCRGFTCFLFLGLSVWSFIFNSWNAWSIGLRSGDWHGNSRTFHVFALINFWFGLLLLYAMGHCTSKLWKAIQSVWLHLGGFEQTAWCFCPASYQE